MKEYTFPKLKWPIKTKHLGWQDRLIVLAYDLIWRSQDFITQEADNDLFHDTIANMSNLGYHIEHSIADGIEFFELDPEFAPEIFDSTCSSLEQQTTGEKSQ